MPISSCCRFPRTWSRVAAVGQRPAFMARFEEGDEPSVSTYAKGLGIPSTKLDSGKRVGRRVLDGDLKRPARLAASWRGGGRVNGKIGPRACCPSWRRSGTRARSSTTAAVWAGWSPR